MEEILIFIAKIASVALGAGIVIISCRKIPFFRVRIFFCLSIAGFCLSSLFFAEEGALLSWVKHFLFYGGQISFLFFIAQAMKIYEDPDLPAAPKPQNQMPVIAQIGAFLNFLAEQGIQHIFTLFLTIAILVFMNARAMIVDFKGKKFPMGIFASAILILTSMHVMEFFIESQKIFALSEIIIETWEFVSVYAGVLVLALGANKIIWPDSLNKKNL
ncbi:hypothetical protein EPN15_01580 [Patescibacteria group bacterium]|nr:MAG: hypothetical protein EPN15_01580 [Patescibacteria group bacterium]